MINCCKICNGLIQKQYDGVYGCEEENCQAYSIWYAEDILEIIVKSGIILHFLHEFKQIKIYKSGQWDNVLFEFDCQELTEQLAKEWFNKLEFYATYF